MLFLELLGRNREAHLEQRQEVLQPLIHFFPPAIVAEQGKNKDLIFKASPNTFGLLQVEVICWIRGSPGC